MGRWSSDARQPELKHGKNRPWPQSPTVGSRANDIPQFCVFHDTCELWNGKMHAVVTEMSTPFSSSFVIGVLRL